MTHLSSDDDMHPFYEDYICSTLESYLGGDDFEVAFGKARDMDGFKRFVMDFYMRDKSLLERVKDKNYPDVPSILPEVVRCEVGIITLHLAQRLRRCLRLDDDCDLPCSSIVLSIRLFDVRYEVIPGWLSWTIREIQDERVLKIKDATVFPE